MNVQAKGGILRKIGCAASGEICHNEGEDRKKEISKWMIFWES